MGTVIGHSLASRKEVDWWRGNRRVLGVRELRGVERWRAVPGRPWPGTALQRFLYCTSHGRPIVHDSDVVQFVRINVGLEQHHLYEIVNNSSIKLFSLKFNIFPIKSIMIMMNFR